MGDAYMAVAGIPEADVDHADSLARTAIRMRRSIEKRNASHAEQWHCRIGIQSGPVIGSTVGVQKYVCDVFGPGVTSPHRWRSSRTRCRSSSARTPASSSRTNST